LNRGLSKVQNIQRNGASRGRNQYVWKVWKVENSKKTKTFVAELRWGAKVQRIRRLPGPTQHSRPV
jgi:hypothetical protein